MYSVELRSGAKFVMKCKAVRSDMAMALPNFLTFYSKQTIYCLKINYNNYCCAKYQVVQTSLKYHIVHDFRTSTSFKEKFSAHFKDLHKVKPLTNFDVNPTSLPGGAMN